MLRPTVVTGAAAILLALGVLHALTSLQLQHHGSSYGSLSIATPASSLLRGVPPADAGSGEGQSVEIAPPSWLSVAVITSKATQWRLEQSLLYCLQPFVREPGGLLLLTDKEDEALPHLLFNASHTMAERVFSGLRHMHDHASPQVRWYLLLDDDTFVFPSTLLHRLASQYGPHRPLTERLYIGNYNENNKGDKFYFAFGGGGVLVSRGLMDYLVTTSTTALTPQEEEEEERRGREQGGGTTTPEGSVGGGRRRDLLSFCLDAERHRPGDYGLYLCLHDDIPQRVDSGFSYPFIQDKSFNQLDIRELAVHFFEAVLPLYSPSTLHHLDLLTYFRHLPATDDRQRRREARHLLGSLSWSVPWYLLFRPLHLTTTIPAGGGSSSQWSYLLYVGYSIRLYRQHNNHRQEAGGSSSREGGGSTSWDPATQLTKVWITWTDWAHWVKEPPVEAIYNHLDSPALQHYRTHPPASLCQQEQHLSQAQDGGGRPAAGVGAEEEKEEAPFARYEVLHASETRHVYQLDAYEDDDEDERRCAERQGLPAHITLLLHPSLEHCALAASPPSSSSSSSSLGPSLGDGGPSTEVLLYQEEGGAGVVLHLCYRPLRTAVMQAVAADTTLRATSGGAEQQ